MNSSGIKLVLLSAIDVLKNEKKNIKSNETKQNPLHTFWNARSQIKSWIEAMHRYVIQHMLNKFQFIIDFQVRSGYVKRCNATQCNAIPNQTHLECVCVASSIVPVCTFEFLFLARASIAK